MFKPSVAQVRTLTKFFVGYRKQNYIAKEFLRPIKDVKKRGKIFVGGDAHLSILGVKTPRTLPAPELDIRSSFTEFDLGTFRRKTTITDEEMADWDLPLTPIKHGLGAVKENLNVEREYALAAWMTTGTNFTNKLDVSTGTKWNVAGGGDAALDNIDTAIAAIGEETNLVLGLSFDTWLGLKRSWQTDLRTAGLQDALMLQAMADYIGIDKVVVGSAKYNTASDPDNPSMARLWGDANAWLVRVADGDIESSHCFGVSAERNAEVKTPRIEDPDGVKAIGKIEFADVVIDETYAYYFYNCV